MSTTAVQEDRDPAQQSGAFRLTPEEVDELDQADAEADDDARAGRLIPIEDVLAKLSRPACAR